MRFPPGDLFWGERERGDRLPPLPRSTSFIVFHGHIILCSRPLSHPRPFSFPIPFWHSRWVFHLWLSSCLSSLSPQNKSPGPCYGHVIPSGWQDLLGSTFTCVSHKSKPTTRSTWSSKPVVFNLFRIKDPQIDTY